MEQQSAGLSEKLVEAMSSHPVWEGNVAGIHFVLTDTIVVMWLIMAVIMVLTLVFVRNLKNVPAGTQNVVEMIVDSLNGLAKGMLHHHWRPFAPYLGTLMIFLVFANTVSIFDIFPFFHIRPPTKNINVTVCMALMTISIVLYSGIRYKKLKGWLHSFVEPMPVILPMKIMEYFTRLLSLSLRLFGNIMGAFVLMELVYMVEPLVIPGFLSIYFDIFDGVLQAFVFVFLSTIYIAEAIE